MVGGLAGALGFAASAVAPRGVAAAVTLGAGIVFTGALHLDGFLDGCDAFVASVSPERRHEILKDPRHGTFAVAGMFVAGTLWYAALNALPPRAYPALAAYAAALARLAAVLNAYVYPYGRGGAITPAFAVKPPVTPLVCQAALLALAGFALGPPLVLALPVAAALALLLGGSIARRLGGGLVGDAYGFIIVVLEVGTLVAVTAAGAYSE
ncbi:MAG: hypothetical protein NVSMB19_24490 [Vulcanimicrobiaceae bacterium]